MKFNTTAKFGGHPLGYHYDFDVDIQKDQIEGVIQGITNLAIKGMRQKCAEVFMIDFEGMHSFEIYYYENAKEVTIFKKVKE